MEKIFLVLLASLVLVVLCSTQTNDQFLIVVGDVGKSHARILYEHLSSSSLHTNVSLYLTVNKQLSSLVETRAILAESRPKVLVFESLLENSNYTVVFGSERLDNNNNSNYTVSATFRTVSNRASGKLIVVSCDRYFEDNDDSMWQQLVRDEPDRLGTIHIGDNIYADVVGKSYRSKIAAGQELPSFEQLVEQYREVYRKTWGQKYAQKILRNGMNLMIPDDHDIYNNLDVQFGDKNYDIYPVVEAGLYAFMEYQYQLHADIDHVVRGKFNEIYFFREFMNVCWMFLDFRFGRALRNDTAHPLIGTEQFRDIEQQLATCGSRNKETVIFTSIPVLFMNQYFAKEVYDRTKERYCNHPHFVADCIKFLNMIGKLVSDKDKQVLVVSGDVHQFFLSDICQGTTCIHQMVTSGMTTRSTVLNAQKLVQLFWTANLKLGASAGSWRMYRGAYTGRRALSQYFGTNYGVIEVNNNSSTAPLTWRGVKSDHESLRDIAVSMLLERVFQISLVLFLAVCSVVIAGVIFLIFINNSIEQVLIPSMDKYEEMYEFEET